MDLGLLFAFIAFNVGLAFTPGPDILCVLTESTTRGKLRGFVLALGFTSGVSVHTLLCATGLAFLINNSPLAILCLKILGSLYLAWLAIEAFREKPTMMELSDGGSPEGGKKPKSLRALYTQGFIMNVINPKVLFFFLIMMPRFVSPEAFLPETAQYFVYGLTFMLITIIVFGSVAVLGGTLRPLLAKAGFWRVERWVRVFLFGGLAAFIALGL